MLAELEVEFADRSWRFVVAMCSCGHVWITRTVPKMCPRCKMTVYFVNCTKMRLTVRDTEYLYRLRANEDLYDVE